MYPTKKLSEICNFEGGSQPPKSEFLYEYTDGYVRFLQIRDFTSDKNITYIPISKKNRICKEDDILLGRYGASVGKILTGKAGAYNVAIIKTIPDLNLLDIRYFYFYLNCSLFQNSLFSICSRAAQDGFSKEDISDFLVPLPPLSTQSHIVARLDEAFASIDEQIALIRANIEDVKNMKIRVIEKIFEEGNFEIKTLKDVCERIMDGTHFSPKNTDSGDRLYVSAKNIKLHGVDLTKATYISQEDHDIIYKRCPVKKGDVLYIKDGATTGIATINQLDEEFSLLSSVAVFKVKKNILSEQFLNYYLNSSFGKKHMISMMGGAAITRLTLTKLNAGQIPLPPLDIQHSIVTHLDSVFATTEAMTHEYETQIADLETMKQSLLREAFEGRLVSE